MSKRRFKAIEFRRQSVAMIEVCNQIIVLYQAQGLRLTLRQLYYQLVTRNIIRNEERAYKSLGSLVSDARLAGFLDWDAIEDRIRQPRTPSEWDNLAGLVESALLSYRLPRWAGQKNYVELWVEKDALAGVLEPLASEFHVTLMVNRGYSSQSAMYDAFRRFRTAYGLKKDCVLLYLGDHDPSGEDMVRDIGDRLNDLFGVEVSVRKVALTMAQVQQYNPPPNPAKRTDSRFERYAEQHGNDSWEVDALPPDVLAQLVRDSLEGLCDLDLMDDVKRQEEEDKANLREAVSQL